MYILGISGFHHDSAVCLIKDGELIAAVEEERLNRIKHSSGLPVQAIQYCLEKEKIGLDQVKYITYYLDQNSKLLHFIKEAIMLKRNPFLSLQLIAYEIYKRADLEVGKLRVAEKIKSKIHKFTIVKHHLAHAASTFFVSPFESAAILVIDSMGEYESTSLYTGKGNKIKKLKSINFPNSIGMFYGSITDYLGFVPGGDEYKVMGLSSYGELDLYSEFKKIISLENKAEYKIDFSYFNYYKTSRVVDSVSDKFIMIFGPPRKPDEEILQRHKDIAACLQKLTEEVILHLITYLYEMTKEENLCIAGGVGLNSVANGKILKNSNFKNIYLAPSSHDSGCAIGGAYYLYNQVLNNKRKYVMDHDYLGPEYSNDQIEDVLKGSRVKYEYFPNIEETAAKKLADGEIIGWFQGRMEFGPRALGNRSILADATRKDMMDIVNKWVKNREDFRPFAPAILEEDVKDYFDIDHLSPFMLFVVPVKKGKEKVIPAVTHIDGTARVQTVSKKTNPRFWNLINEFKKKTDVPVVLNTSFNIKGEPIVCTPKDALRCFFSTGLDCLIMNNYIITK